MQRSVARIRAPSERDASDTRRILIVGLNYAPERVGIGPYTAGLAEALAAGGSTVSVIAGKPYYPAWKTMPGYARLYDRRAEAGVTIIRVPHYVPARPSGARRILHHLSFALAALPVALVAAVRARPQVVLVVVPSMISAPVARLAAWLAGARLWMHVQDFEVEAAFATGLVSASGRGARYALAFERRQLLAADRVSSISPRMCARLAAKGVAAERIVELRNWAEIDTIRPLTAPSPYRTRWAIDRPHVALYSGNIANKQGVEIIVAAARLLAHRQDLLFVICGDGSNRAALAAAAGGLPNIMLQPLQPAEDLSDLLGLATVHLLPQLAGAADLVLPSKLANMLASGRPVVATASPGTGVADEITGGGLAGGGVTGRGVAACGVATAPGDVAAIAAAIEAMVDDPVLAAALGQAGRERAVSRWSRAALLDQFRREIEACADGA